MRLTALVCTLAAADYDEDDGSNDDNDGDDDGEDDDEQAAVDVAVDIAVDVAVDVAVSNETDEAAVKVFAAVPPKTRHMVVRQAAFYTAGEYRRSADDSEWEL